VSEATLISYAQNGEDVVLWRALGHVREGRYVDVGACDPVDLSVTKALYDRGWRGVDIDAVPAYVDRLQRARPDNEVVLAAITDREVDTITLHELVGTGLSTLVDETAEAHERAGFQRRDITVPAMSLDAVCEQSKIVGAELHVLKVDVEGAEAEVLRSFDLRRWKPWVVLVEATQPLSTEPAFEDWDPMLTEAGYTFTLFDGVSRYYVAKEHSELGDRLSYPACSLDDYVPVRQHQLDVRVDELTADVTASRQEANRWRNEAVGYWARAVAQVQSSEDAAQAARREADRLRAQVAKVRERLAEAREDRRRLRERVKRLTARINELEHEPPGVGGARGRLRATVKKVTGA
jgi:FkbM family methyltransferase